MRQKSSYYKLLALNEAFCDAELTPSDKVVFQRLVWRLNLKTGACFPSIKFIAAELSMTERGVRKCVARLEKHGYLKRRIHAGRTKANDYLISGLNTERTFPKTGTNVPEERNTGSAHIRKEKEKEKEAGEAEAQSLGVSSSPHFPPMTEVAEEHFQCRLAEAFGGGAQGWDVLMNVPADTLDELENSCRRGSMRFHDAVEVIRIGALEVAAHGQSQ